MRARIIVMAVMGAILLLLISSIMTAPKRISWKESFSNRDKNPYGAYALYDMLPALFGDTEIEETREMMYYSLDMVGVENTSYIAITDELNADEYDVSILLSFVEDGNYAFLVARDLPIELKDSLNLRITSQILDAVEGDTLEAEMDTTYIRFANPAFARYQGFDLKRAGENWWFELDDESEALVLAYNHFDQPNLLKVPYGDGFFILGTSPRMFSNYFLLYRDNHQYAEIAFSYLPRETEAIFWDEYYKRGRYGRNNPQQEEPDLLAYIRSEPALNWAYWIVAFAVLAYVFFESKRKQRMIPEHKPLPNATLEFTETVGRLYYQSHDHKNVAEKKIKILLAYIRSQYFLKTNEFNQGFIDTLAGKSGMDINEVRILCRMIERIRQRDQISESELLELNLLVESFYLHANGRQ